MRAFFDRFECNSNSQSSKNENQLIFESIQKEVERILSTQSSFDMETYKDKIQNPLNRGWPGLFGVPPFPFSNPNKPDFWPQYARLCEQAMCLFEPRIKQASVTIQGLDSKGQSVGATIYLILEKELTYSFEYKFPIGN